MNTNKNASQGARPLVMFLIIAVAVLSVTIILLLHSKDKSESVVANNPALSGTVHGYPKVAGNWSTVTSPRTVNVAPDVTQQEIKPEVLVVQNVVSNSSKVKQITFHIRPQLGKQTTTNTQTAEN